MIQNFKYFSGDIREAKTENLSLLSATTQLLSWAAVDLKVPYPFW